MVNHVSTPLCRWAASLGVAFLSIALALRAASAAEVVLSSFNNAGFQYTFDGFSQTLGPAAVRLSDAVNGWGGGGRNASLNLSSLADGRVVVDVLANPGHGADTFTVELYDSAGNSGKWQFTAPQVDPQFTRLVSQTTLQNPIAGVGDYQNLNLSAITSWNILGHWQSLEPFDLSFDRLAISNEVDPPPPYAGYEPDAPWRAEAAARIDAIRKADLAIQVVDAVGNPLPGAQVHAAMQRHEFGFGSAVTASLINPTNANSATYRSKIEQLFNVAVLENDLKWPAWIGEWGPSFNKPQAQAALAWLNSQGIDVRGHNMVWPGTDNLPAAMRTLLGNPSLSPAQQQQLRDMIAARIADVGGAVAGKVTEWDVINEPRANHDVQDALPEGPLAMADWFAAARSADPNAKLYLNEYDIVASGGNTDTASQQTYFDALSQLISAGAPIDGLGMQGHFSASTLTGPEQAWEIFDRFAQLGLDMAITEFDFGTTDEQLQAAFTRDFLTAVFAHEGFHEFLAWGFWEGAHWRPEAAMFRQDWSIKPNGQAYFDLVLGQWWTDEVVAANAAGSVALRGFKGDYLVSGEWRNAMASASLGLSSGGASATITLDLLAADVDGSRAVDAADLATIATAWGSSSAGDASGDGATDGADVLLWQRQQGLELPSLTAVPEPSEAVATSLVPWAFAILARRTRR